ncbi:unnamed protein product [Discosporangium mesarthrocarpum]
MTCLDKRQLCDLNCVYPGVDNANGEDLNECGLRCISEEKICVDKPETVEYVACTVTCTRQYSDSLMFCNQGVSTTTTCTQGANLDACANKVSGVMDDCMVSCSLRKEGGWGIKAEEGVGCKVQGMRTLLRLFLRQKESVYFSCGRRNARAPNPEGLMGPETLLLTDRH